MYYRLKDPAQGFSGGENTRFSLHNPCDVFLFKCPYLIALELKSVNGTSLSFSLEDNKKVIKKCQIDGLKELVKFQGIFGGFLINFRKTEKTYYISINDFERFVNSTSKKSINEKDILKFNGVIIPQRKKKVRYVYDINFLMNEVIDR